MFKQIIDSINRNSKMLIVSKVNEERNNSNIKRCGILSAGGGRSNIIGGVIPPPPPIPRGCT